MQDKWLLNHELEAIQLYSAWVNSALSALANFSGQTYCSAVQDQSGTTALIVKQVRSGARIPPDCRIYTYIGLHSTGMQHPLIGPRKWSDHLADINPYTGAINLNE